MLSSDDYGRDLASVQALLRKHDSIERDLSTLEALEAKVETLGVEADKLVKDVAGAEALLERHQEHRGEID